MITIDELIKRDLYKEIRTYTDHDDSDWPTTWDPPIEISACNREEFEKQLESDRQIETDRQNERGKTYRKVD